MDLSVANATAAFEMVLSPGAGRASAAGKSALRARGGGWGQESKLKAGLVGGCPLHPPPGHRQCQLLTVSPVALRRSVTCCRIAGSMLSTVPCSTSTGARFSTRIGGSLYRKAPRGTRTRSPVCKVPGNRMTPLAPSRRRQNYVMLNCPFSSSGMKNTASPARQIRPVIILPSSRTIGSGSVGYVSASGAVGSVGSVPSS